MKPILFLAAVLSVGVTSWAQGQERRPVSERQESKDGSGAQPAFAAASGRLSQDNEAAAPHLVKFSGVLLDVAGKPLSGEVEVTFALYKQQAERKPEKLRLFSSTAWKRRGSNKLVAGNCAPHAILRAFGMAKVEGRRP